MANPVIRLHRGDLPPDVSFAGSVAVDTETLGLKPHRDRLCLIQLSAGDNSAHLVQLGQGSPACDRLKAVLTSPSVLKIFHFGRFDIAVLKQHLGVDVFPVYCTKIASKLARTYTDRHGLRDLAGELLHIELSKQQQSSDWGAGQLSQQQLHYAAADVLHLHAIKRKLDDMLAREGRDDLAEACFRFLPTRAALDLAGFDGDDILAH